MQANFTILRKIN